MKRLMMIAVALSPLAAPVLAAPHRREHAAPPGSKRPPRLIRDSESGGRRLLREAHEDRRRDNYRNLRERQREARYAADEAWKDKLYQDDDDPGCD